MEQEKASVTVKIYGAEFKLTGHSNADYLRRVAAYVDEQMHKVAGSAPRMDLSKLATLAALQLAEEVFRLERDSTALHEIEQRYNQLVIQYDSSDKQHASQLEALTAQYEQRLEEVTSTAGAELASTREFYEERITLLRDELASALGDTKAHIEKVRTEMQQEIDAAHASRDEVEAQLAMLKFEQEHHLVYALEEQEARLTAEAAAELERVRLEYEAEIARLIDAQAEAVSAQLLAESEKTRTLQEMHDKEEAIRREHYQNLQSARLNYENELRKETVRLQQKYESQLRLGQTSGTSDSAMQEELNQLRTEYEKLKSEYNEWIELYEQNRT